MDNTQLIRVLRHNKIFDTIFNRLPCLDLPDVWVASGAVFQTVWNHLTNREPDYGIKDYNILYYDDSDLSKDAENKVIADVENLFRDLPMCLEVRNQARIPIWFQKKFGIPCAPIESSKQAINRFLSPLCMLGVQPRKGGIEVYAPFGFVDVKNMYIRPNLSSSFRPDIYFSKVIRWRQYWPEARMEQGGDKIYLKYLRGDGT